MCKNGDYLFTKNVARLRVTSISSLKTRLIKRLMDDEVKIYIPIYYNTRLLKNRSVLIIKVITFSAQQINADERITLESFLTRYIVRCVYPFTPVTKNTKFIYPRVKGRARNNHSFPFLLRWDRPSNHAN